LDVLDQIIVVGAGDSFEDDVMIALNGQSLMSLSSFHKIDFEGAHDHMDGGKTDGRCNNINLTYGYSKQGFQLEPNEDGLHPPSLLNNSKNKPLIGKQYLALSNLIAEFDQTRSNMTVLLAYFMHATNMPNLLLRPPVTQSLTVQSILLKTSRRLEIILI
jgi:hypothetical protein